MQHAQADVTVFRDFPESCETVFQKSFGLFDDESTMRVIFVFKEFLID